MTKPERIHSVDRWLGAARDASEEACLVFLVTYGADCNLHGRLMKPFAVDGHYNYRWATLGTQDQSPSP
jgi:hypothetical protein